jgi:hypothetical protein
MAGSPRRDPAIAKSKEKSWGSGSFTGRPGRLAAIGPQELPKKMKPTFLDVLPGKVGSSE